MRFDQKSPALSVLVVDRGDIFFKDIDIATYRKNWHRGRFFEKFSKFLQVTLLYLLTGMTLTRYKPKGTTLKLQLNSYSKSVIYCVDTPVRNHHHKTLF